MAKLFYVFVMWWLVLALAFIGAASCGVIFRLMGIGFRIGYNW